MQIVLLATLWYVLFLLFGALVLPIAMRVFRGLPEGGILLARPLGWLLFGFLSWYGSYWLGLPFTLLGLVMVLALLFASSIFLLRSKLPWYRRKWRIHWRTALNGELIALAVFILMIAVRSIDPELNSTEKPMDLMMLSALAFSDHIPPQDLWYAGEPINYHYGGYLLHSLPIKLTGVLSEYAYNLALATTVSMAALGAFILGRFLFGRCRWGVIAVLATLFLGNWAAYDLARNRDALPGDLYQLKFGYLWNTSRVILDNPDRGLGETINEYPFFTILWGDLHPHFSNIPFFFFFMAITYATFQALRRNPPKRFLRHQWPLLATAVAAGGFLLPTNIFDFPILSLLWGGATLCALLLRCAADRRPWQEWAWVAWVPLLPLLGYLAASPFWLHFSNPLHGDLLAWVEVRTGLFEFMLVFGAHFIATLLYLGLRLGPLFTSRSREETGFILAIAAIALVIVWGLTGHLIATLTPVMALLLAAFALLSAWPKTNPLQLPKNQCLRESFALLVCALAWALIAGCEYLYIPDNYASKRMNTLFKFHFAAWLLLGIGLPALLYFALNRIHHWGKRLAATLPVLILLLIGLYSPAYSMISLGNIGLKRDWTLNGLNYLQSNPNLVNMIVWVRENTPPDARLLELPGSSYSGTDNILSAATGRPAVIGWTGHQHLWRGNQNPVFQRQEDVFTMLTTPDWSAAQSLFERYQVDYVVIYPVRNQQANERIPQMMQSALLRELTPIQSWQGAQPYAIFEIPQPTQSAGEANG